jgi:hypothetical protein
VISSPLGAGSSGIRHTGRSPKFDVCRAVIAEKRPLNAPPKIETSQFTLPCNFKTSTSDADVLACDGVVETSPFRPVRRARRRTH